MEEVIIEFDLDKDFLSSINFYNEQYKKNIFEYLMIDAETLKFKLTMNQLRRMPKYFKFNFDIILNNQTLKESQIYIFCGYYDSSEECYGPTFGYPDNYIYGIYENIYDKSNNQELILKDAIDNFEKGKMIIHLRKYVYSYEIKKIFEEELLNTQNKSLNDCVIQTRIRIENLSYLRSPEYKEKVLLDRINELYKKVKGQFIQKEVLYNGYFLDILSETYKLPNDKIVKKEKIIKNDGKNSVIIIAINQNNEFIIIFQNRIKDKIIAEFPSGYIEIDEGVIEAAKRELQEETGYISDDLFIVDEAYTSLGIDNSVTYIVIANNCIKTNQKTDNGNELINYGLFSETELKYLINNNIMNGAMNKLAYYNLISNFDNCDITYAKTNQKRYKKL
ncbi:MAG: NUDIX hydrolase [Bacilli bacterium]